MVQYLYKNVKNEKIQNVDAFKRGCWIYVTKPSIEELTSISNDLNLDFDILKDVLDNYEVPRLENDEGTKYIFTRYVVNKNLKLETEPILIVFSNEFVLTVSYSEATSLKKLKSKNINTTQKTKLLIEILSTINDEIKHEVNSLSKEIKNLSSKIETISNAEISKFVEHERALNDIIATLVPTNIIFRRLIDSKSIQLYEDDLEIIEDLTISTNQLIEICKSDMKYLVNIREAFSTILSNNLNKTMKMLTSLTVILTTPTIISSFFGMNVNVPLNQNPSAFLMIIAFTTIILAILIYLFNKNKLM